MAELAPALDRPALPVDPVNPPLAPRSVQLCRFDDALLSLPGGLALGKTWSTGPQQADPFELRDALEADGLTFARYRGGQVAAAVSGRFTNGPRLRRELKEQGALFHGASDAELLLHLLALSPQRTFVNRLVDALWKVEGAWSLVVAFNTRELEPLAPGRSVHLFRNGVVMQKIVIAQVGGYVQRTHSRQQSRTAYCRVGRRKQSLTPAAGRTAATEANGQH